MGGAPITGGRPLPGSAMPMPGRILVVPLAGAGWAPCQGSIFAGGLSMATPMREGAPRSSSSMWYSAP
jgi:hypothetical protein